MNRINRFPLKVYLERVEQTLSQCDATELRAMLRKWAAEQGPGERCAFLARLGELRAGKLVAVAQDASLLQDIALLRDELEAKAQEEPDWGRFGCDNSDSLGEFEEFIEPLTSLFDRAEASFDAADFSLACRAYEELFQLLQIENECGQGVRFHDLPEVDREESRARYLRSTYVVTPLSERANTMLECFQSLAANGFERVRVSLKDIINIAVAPLPDFEEFLVQWIGVVRKGTDARSDAWLREAVILQDGSEGIRQLALAEGEQRPRAFLDWVMLLGSAEAMEAAEIALARLPENLPIRAAIADRMAECLQAAGLPDGKVRWLSFEAKPSLQKLVALFESADGGARGELMRRCAGVIAHHLAHPRASSDGWERDGLELAASVDGRLLSHAHLLSGNASAALSIAQKEGILGWSSRGTAQPLCVAFGLVKMSGLPLRQLPVQLRSLWVSAISDEPSGYECEQGECSNEGGDFQQRLDAAYEKASTPLPPEFAAWCLKTAEARVSAIVSNTHRRAYGRAATLAAACHETLLASGNGEKARGFLQGIHARFSRHPAFQRALGARVRNWG